MDTQKGVLKKENVTTTLSNMGKGAIESVKKAGRFTMDAFRWSALSIRFHYLSHVRDKKFIDLGKMSYATFMATQTVPKESVAELIDDIYALEKTMTELERERRSIGVQANNKLPGNE